MLTSLSNVATVSALAVYCLLGLTAAAPLPHSTGDINAEIALSQSSSNYHRELRSLKPHKYTPLKGNPNTQYVYKTTSALILPILHEGLLCETQQYWEKEIDSHPELGVNMIMTTCSKGLICARPTVDSWLLSYHELFSHNRCVVDETAADAVTTSPTTTVSSSTSTSTAAAAAASITSTSTAAAKKFDIDSEL